MFAKKIAPAILAVAFLGAGLVAPAHADTTETAPVTVGSVSLPTVTDEDAELAGPGGSFSIGQSGELSRSAQPTIAAVFSEGTESGELLLSASISDPANVSTTYSLTLPESSTAEVITNDRGEESVLLLNADGELLGGIAAADVFDASGAAVPTTFNVDGTTVTQTLSPGEGAKVAYPVTMAAAASTVWYSSGWVTTNSKGYIVNAAPTALGRQQIAWNTHYIHVEHLKSILGSQAYRVNWNIEQQFVCHVVGAFLDTGVYNMESWQPALSWGEISNPWDRCNRIK